MGMSPSDKEGNALWVDMLGDAITRDLEPTVEDGGALWKVHRLLHLIGYLDDIKIKISPYKM